MVKHPANDLSRRDFLKIAGKSAIISSGLLASCATTATPTRTTASAIDVHHHYIPMELIDEVKKNGKALGVEYFPPKDAKDNPLRIQFPKGNRLNPDPRMAEVPNRLEAMTKGNIGIATVEAHTACVGYELDGERGETWSKLYNEAIMNLVKRHPNRFAGIATVPLQDPTRAAKVLEHAVVSLKMSGVTIASNVVGKYFNDKSFDPFWKKAEDLDVMMIMHPEWVAGADKMDPFSLRSICGNPADTTLSVTYMIYTGIFDRFPSLKLCLLHGGGYFPYHLGRLDQDKTGGSGASAIPSKYPPSKYLKNLYFDNLVYRVETLEYLKRMVGADHIMVGTDYPFDLGDWMAADKLQTMECTSAEREAMLHGNARRLLRMTAA
ncbi:MAG: amidohydrolase [Deltaproteobacteria bacterium]|nr:amidohydrolase [Deltaproteobacteria bacterium]